MFDHGDKTGKLLAWLARDQVPSAHIEGIRDEEGLTLSDPVEFNAKFALYSQQLYSSRAQYSIAQLVQYLDKIEFPVLSDTARQRLYVPISSDMIKRALKSIPTGKTLGVDGLPAEFYRAHADLLFPHLHETLKVALTDNQLPQSMSEAVLVVVPKPGKDPALGSSYRPISLLNINAKILTKALANRLNSVILHIVHGDQSGKGTDINLR